MRKIDKTRILSTVYKDWEEELEEKGIDHPSYSSSHRFYLDVVMNLYYCQGGLCAYTEKRICERPDYVINKWKTGKYEGNKPNHFGELEHFDSSLKRNKGWLWENFFMVDCKVNRQKLDKHVSFLLKPDQKDYNPFDIFEYNRSTHVFIANTKKFSQEEQDEINNWILILGINYVVGPRRRYLTEKIQLIEDFGIETWDSIEIDEYPTAFEFIRSQRLVP